MSESAPDGWHWQKSCEINARYFGGDPSQPVCARVYASERRFWHLIFFGLMVLYFKEWGHCRRIFHRWLELQPYDPPQVTGRTGPDAGY